MTRPAGALCAVLCAGHALLLVGNVQVRMQRLRCTPPWLILTSAAREHDTESLVLALLLLLLLLLTLVQAALA
jgi:hypothetical protein